MDAGLSLAHNLFNLVINVLRQDKSAKMNVFNKTLVIRSFCILSIIVAVSLTTAVSYAANSKPAIKVGSEVEFPPFAIVDENGQADGFSVDLIKAVAKAMDLPIVITTGSWDTMWNNLVSGQLDVLPIVAKSPERQRLVDFSLSHTETFDAFFVRSGSPEIRDIESAHGKKIVVMRSDAAHHALLEHKFQGEIVLVDTIPEGLKMVASGKNDAFLCSKLIGILAIKKHSIKGLKAGPLVPDYKRVFSFGVRKGADELREKLNQGLLIIKSSGEYDRIYEKWLGFDDPWRKYKRYLLITVVVLGVIAVAAIFWSAMLRIMVKRRTAELAIKKESLEQEIVNRKRIEEELRKHRENLELLIEERTRDLRTSEVKFSNLFNNSEVGMFRTRLDGSEILDANEKFLNIFGRAREEVIGKPSVIHWADPHEREEMIKRLKEHGRVAEFECRMLNKKGEVLHCITSLVLYSEQGILEGTIMDITERKNAEEVLQRYFSELEKSNKELQEAIAKVKTLSGMLPICSYCKKIRDDKGYWKQVEVYISEHTDTMFSHGMCPDCAKKAYEELDELKKKNTEFRSQKSE
ncbi:MAG: transporter substrate-binding domain-containing protein [Thermodesulfovibrionales bacterium]